MRAPLAVWSSWSGRVSSGCDVLGWWWCYLWSDLRCNHQCDEAVNFACSDFLWVRRCLDGSLGLRLRVSVTVAYLLGRLCTVKICIVYSMQYV
jgi:hypothetical protein